MSFLVCLQNKRELTNKHTYRYIEETTGIDDGVVAHNSRSVFDGADWCVRVSRARDVPQATDFGFI